MKTLRLFKIAFAVLIFGFSGLDLSAQTFTFTNAGAIGNAGPTQSQVDVEYASTTLDGKVTVSGGIQRWVVPFTALYKIEAYGAQGSNASTTTGGLGAYISGEFMLTQGDTLSILVGQNAPNTPARVNLSSSGGGGTFITKFPHNTNASILVIAGGGGGTGNERPYTANASMFTSGNTGSHGTGGTNGDGGLTATTAAGGGGGFFTDGDGTAGGDAYVNGGAGGPVNTTYSVNGGGFGGGGSVTGGGNSRYAGGGGYSGGSGSTSQAGATTGLWGGGGGSYNNGTNQVNDTSIRMGHGMAVITILSSGAPYDAGVLSVDSPNVYCAGSHNVVASIQNFGTEILDSVTVNWSVDGIAQTSVKYIGTLDTTGGTGSVTAQVNLGSFSFTSASYELLVWTSMPNGNPDTVNTNDTTPATKQANLPPPTGLSVKAASDTTATIGWIGGGSTNTWVYSNLFFGTAPSGSGSATSVDSANLTGLTRATTYDFYVREVCPTGDTSIWAGPLTYQTPCSNPLNGTYTVNPNQAVSNSNFVSLADALYALNECGISGAVTINVEPNSGPYLSGGQLTAIPGASATNTITFNGNGNEINEGAETYFLALDGVSYLTINDFRFINTNPTVPMFGIMIRGGSHHINITDNLIDMGMGYTSSLSAAIAVSSSTTSATTAGNNGQYITITGNELVGAYYGITLIGQSSYADNYGHVISNNIIRDYYIYGVFMVNADTIIVEENNFSRNIRTTLSTFYGVYVSSGRNIKIHSNEIHSSGVGSYTAYTIYITTSVNSSGYETEIVNNLIHNIPTSGTHYGMYLLGTRDYVKIYHNTIDIESSNSTGNKRAIFASTSPDNHELKNNILSIRGSGTGIKYCIYISTTSTSFSSNYNVLYNGATAGTNHTGYWTANRSTLSDWQSNSSQDANSKDDNPHFANPAGLIITPLNVAIDNMGTPVGVTTDILDSSRSSTAPDVGGIEFTGISGDIALMSAELTRTGKCYNPNDTVEFVISNVFGSTADFSTNPLTLVWEVSGPVNSSDTLVINSGTLAANASMVVTDTNVLMTVPGMYYLTAHILSNSVNPSAFNDTLVAPFEYTVEPILVVNPKMTTMTSYSDSLLIAAISPFITAGNVLTTSLTSNNNSGGNYFDITVDNAILLKGFEVNNSSTTTATYQIYYRQGTYVGNNGNSSGWTSLGTYNVPSAGVNNPTEIELTNSLLLVPDTYALYIVATSGSHYYINGTAVGAVWASNADLTIYEGLGTDLNPFSTVAFSPRNFSGSILYGPPAQTVSGLTWSEGSTVIDSTQSIYVGPYTNHGTYKYIATYNTVCGTYTDTATVIMPPRIDVSVELPLPAQACESTSLPVMVKLTNSSLIEDIDFDIDTARLVVSVTGAVNQTFNLELTDNSLNNNLPLEMGNSVMVSMGNLNFNTVGSYYIAASVQVTGDGNSANDIMLDTVVVKPTPVINAGVDQLACLGATVNLNGSASNGTGFSYQWTPSAGLSNAGIAAPSFTAMSNEKYFLMVTNAEGCSSEDSTTVNVSDIAANAGADFQVCTGSPTVIGINNGGSGGFGTLSYSWSPGSMLSDSTLERPMATVPSTTIFTLTVTDSIGCTATDQLLVEGLSVPSPIVSGVNSVCSGLRETYRTPFNSGTTYQWQVTGGTVIGSSTADTLVVEWGSAGNSSVKVTQTITAGGCFATTPDYSVTVNASAATTVIPTTPTTVCQGSAATLVTIPATGVSYQWRRNGVNISGATSNTLNASQTGEYKLVATTNFGCIDSSAAVSVVVNPTPAASITASGSTTLCDGQTVNLNASTGIGLTYQWLRNNSSIQSATSASYSAGTSGDYAVRITDSNNCQATSAVETVTVNPLPSASISASGATTFCQGGNVMLSAFAGAGYTYQWRQNGSNISSATSSTYNATSSGTYSVEVNTAQGCEAISNNIAVTVNALPSATASAGSATTFCEGGSVNISANTGTGLSYLWMRDGNTISGATSSSYSAGQSGNYTVRVTNASGCENVSSAVSVTVNPMPFVAIASVGSTTICEGDQANLIAIASGASNYQWLRNGSDISGATSTSYSATDNGTYSLRVTTSQGCSEVSNTVGVTRNVLPDSAITTSGPLSFCPGGSVTLSASATAGVSHQWQRNSSNITGGTASTFVASSSGDYRMIITNNTTGCVNMSAVRSITVLDIPEASFTAMNTCLGDSVSFNNNSAAAGTLSYNWTFGDGNTSTAENPMHLYAAAGTYQVSLLVSSADGCMDSIAEMVEVYPQPVASFVANDVCDGESVNFSNNSSIPNGSIASYSWNFGDNSTSISSNPVHTYAGTGTYAVTLTVTSLRGCEVQTTDSITISPRPVADFTAANECSGKLINFMNNSSSAGGGMTYNWMFGDGNASIDENPSHMYDEPGIYQVILYTYSNKGCMAADTMQVQVYALPEADFSATAVCEDEPTVF
ncbi:MAG: PKD domain-containing protein, partial [Bacteroidia bacterium]